MERLTSGREYSGPARRLCCSRFNLCESRQWLGRRPSPIWRAHCSRCSPCLPICGGPILALLDAFSGLRLLGCSTSGAALQSGRADPARRSFGGRRLPHSQVFRSDQVAIGLDSRGDCGKAAVRRRGFSLLRFGCRREIRLEPRDGERRIGRLRSAARPQLVHGGFLSREDGLAIGTFSNL